MPPTAKRSVYEAAGTYRESPAFVDAKLDSDEDEEYKDEEEFEEKSDDEEDVRFASSLPNQILSRTMTKI